MLGKTLCCWVFHAIKEYAGTRGAQGPQADRMLTVLPVHFKNDTALFDGGNVICEKDDLETAQKELAQLTTKVINSGYSPVILGGGHEMAWGTFQGIARSEMGGGVTGIINLDAHFDLRKPSKQGPSSGTPFYQIAEWQRSSQQPFKYFVGGIQQMSNTRALYERAQQLGTVYVTSEEIRNDTEKANEKLIRFIKSVDQIYFTVCLDVFNSAYAPGVSAPNPLGIHPHEATGLIRVIKNSKKLIAADIAEMNPRFDCDQRTTRLAASLIFEMLAGQP